MARLCSTTHGGDMTTAAELKAELDKQVAYSNHLESMRNTPQWGSWESQQVYYLDREIQSLRYRYQQALEQERNHVS